MTRIVAATLIIGFTFIDFLFFHDILKPGESPTAAQYLTGLLSLGVFYLSARLLTTDQRIKH